MPAHDVRDFELARKFGLPIREVVAGGDVEKEAYVADGVNGLRILQLTSPETVPQYGGFSPAPKPVLIATYPTPSPAKSLEKPLDRDRAVDEGGNQLAVFGR